MDYSQVVAGIDAQIERLQQARRIILSLNGNTGTQPTGGTRGPRRAGRRTMSAAGRARIVAAQRARWAKVRAKAKKINR